MLYGRWCRISLGLRCLIRLVWLLLILVFGIFLLFWLMVVVCRCGWWLLLIVVFLVFVVCLGLVCVCVILVS